MRQAHSVVVAAGTLMERTTSVYSVLRVQSRREWVAATKIENEFETIEPVTHVWSCFVHARVCSRWGLSLW